MYVYRINHYFFDMYLQHIVHFIDNMSLISQNYTCYYFNIVILFLIKIFFIFIAL